MLTTIRRAWRRQAPDVLQVAIALFRRKLRDYATGVAKEIIEPERMPRTDSFKEAICLVQPIRRTQYWEGKLHNLKIAAGRLNWIQLPPHKILSFWAAVGAPTEKNGFRLGRSIRSDSINADVGGGLCQISGLLYELGLRAGLRVVERWAHTQDLYTDETRFTALGLDATVVWGHKDLRLRNDFGHLLAFSFEVTADEICGRLFSERPLHPLQVTIINEKVSDSRHVSVFREQSGQQAMMSSDIYRLADPKSLHYTSPNF